MKKLAVTVLLALTFSGSSLADEGMVGKWLCSVVSEYGEFEFALILSDDNTYVKKQNMFGEIGIGVGTWAADDKELVMNRETYSKNGEEKASSQEFRRDIVSVSETELEMKHGEVVTTCTRK
jgi:hypothetical protein